MEKDEELKNSELQQHHEDMDGEGEDYGDDEDFIEEHQDQMDDQMEGEEEYDNEAEEMQNPYDQNDAIRNTFYPAQNPIMGGYGGALRPVSANVMKDRNRKMGFGKGKGKKTGFSRGIDDDFDVRTRPKNFVKDREGLYDDAIKLKKSNNNLK